MPYITPEMLEFLAGIRANNNKEWFEPRKAFYAEQVYEPLKALAAALYEPYEGRGDMMYKCARIYKDANFPPYLHYRDTMWIYIRHEALYWSRTPTLFFEVAPEGARCGFRISSPAPAFMAYFRDRLLDDAAEFRSIIHALKAGGIELSGDEYKRPKPCPEELLLPYFKKKSLAAEVNIAPGSVLFGDELLPRAREILERVFPLHEYIQSLLNAFEEQSAPAPAAAPDEPLMPQAPSEDFMW